MNIEGRIQVRVERQIWLDREFAIHVGVRNEDRQLFVAEPATFREIERGTPAVTPMLALTGEGAQALIDELWRAGLRPTEGTGSAGALAAVQGHLQDMRRIALQGVPTLIEGGAKR